MRRVLTTLALLLVAAAALLAARQNDLLTDRAQGYAQSIAVNASATYITLRTLNAFLSAAQEIEVGVSLVGQGSAQPLKTLEPIDDTIERIADVVFWVMLASGTLAVALGPVSTIGLVMLSAAAGLWAGVAASGRANPLGGVPRQLAVYGGFLGLALPLAFAVADPLSDRLTDATWEAQTRIVQEITATVDTLPVDEGLRDKIARYTTLAENLWNRADDLIASLLTLLAVFIFKVVVLPILLMGGLLVIARGLARPTRSVVAPATIATDPPTR
ncbi:hypothetical protein PARPLA_01636 [Rhodobacteraceae bacterium THAF1]|uniref:hypothetical protein n=1 Tax=Palleronia sp. THAF1 TaxID=2587842 RepID=UPI000F3E1AE7|nr:hypothetical protein [Palleronia sp. THAF1]QFU07720.1 hypothetical protein FIU81_03425 [Palleronia sp. THAF1]VDC23188.1 hypothetical protein PARPLA_01636 [Rhodobacteraceae bacterium THAF1]